MDARFGTYLTHSKQDTRHNVSHVHFVSNGATRLGFTSFSVLFNRGTKYFNTYFKNSY